MSFQVIFQPSGRRGSVAPGKTLLEAARELGVDIESPCGGGKICGKCKVKIEEGFFEKFGINSLAANLSPLSAEEEEFLKVEEIRDNYRLACVAQLRGDVLVFVPEESRGAPQVVLETGRERPFQLNPAVRKYTVEVAAGSLQDQRSDWERLKAALTGKYALPEDISADYFALTELPRVTRQEKGLVTVTVWGDSEVTRVEAGLKPDLYGMAVDVGTTTVAAYLCDLAKGRVLATESQMNPQVRYGEDVLSRITYAMMNDDGLTKLHSAIIDGLNRLIGGLTEKAGLTREDVAEVTLVFNTVMQHIALNIVPDYVGRAPFLPAVKDAYDIKARDLGIRINPAGNVHTLPVEAGFVGPDNVAVLVAEEPYKQEKQLLIIDIGTNGEIVLGNRDRLASTSCATGPALEGAQIQFGMRAAPGAIERIKIDAATLEVRYKVIGLDTWYPDIDKTDAKGICGSGIIDAVAELFKAGIILASGRFNPKANSPRLRRDAGGKPEFVLAWARETSINKDITITQGDIRAVQLAKSALYVGAKFLQRKLGVTSLDGVILAGAFGSYIDRENALALGMFPDCAPENIRAVGNAAGDGAKLALFDRDKRSEAQRVARWVQFVETATEPDFQKEFAYAMAFPHARDEFPHLKEVLAAIPNWE